MAGKRPARATWLSGLALLLGLALQVQAQDASNYQVAGSIAAYLGVIPAQIVAGHPTNHPETRMHGGPPAGPHAEHLVIALFDNPSGTRIEDATVEATIAGLGDTGITPITLDPMLISGVITYGGYVRFPGADTYTIDLLIYRPGTTPATKIRFSYQHGGS